MGKARTGRRRVFSSTPCKKTAIAARTKRIGDVPVENKPSPSRRHGIVSLVKKAAVPVQKVRVLHVGCEKQDSFVLTTLMMVLRLLQLRLLQTITGKTKTTSNQYVNG